MGVLALVGWSRMAARAPLLGWLMGALAGGSVILIGATTAAFPQPPASLSNPFAELALPLLQEGFGAGNLGAAMGLHRWSLLPWLLALALCALGISVGPALKARRRGAALLSATTMLGFVAAWALWHPSPRVQAASALSFARKVTEGARPDRPDRFIE